ncbi:MAG TPA: shikimate kinase [Bryobacteraceae bacterium]|jgi:shikimate kinase|nr:shikimate kinase [Bryobacteraceae bacterium]
MDIKLKRAPGVYLAGFMASGKTTVARLLADRLGWDFIDLDAEIEAVEQTTIARLFESRGEPEFRRIETEALRNLMRRIERGMPSVIALGGGSFVQPVNTTLLSDHGISIWLDCSFETIETRINSGIEEADSRPLTRDREQFRRLYDERRTVYARADYRVDADCEVERAVDLILDLPCWK